MAGRPGRREEGAPPPLVFLNVSCSVSISLFPFVRWALGRLTLSFQGIRCAADGCKMNGRNPFTSLCSTDEYVRGSRSARRPSGGRGGRPLDQCMTNKLVEVLSVCSTCNQKTNLINGHATTSRRASACIPNFTYCFEFSGLAW
jgi:hypothetical protein